MKIIPSLILSFILVGFWSCSDAGDPLSNDCAEVLDCAGVCGGSSLYDTCGICDGDGSTCNISYSSIIQPIFDNHCIGCHNESHSTELDLKSHTGVISGSKTGPVIISGNGSESSLIQKLLGTASGMQMPASGCCLDISVIQLIETWIDEGALDN